MSEQRGAAIGRMVQSKGASYGNAYPRVAKALKAMLEVEGVDAGTPLKLSEAQLRELPYITRLLEKVCRVLHGGPKALGEDAWEDVAGIALARLAEEGVSFGVQTIIQGHEQSKWLHAATSENRVVCLENVDAPDEWRRISGLSELFAVDCPYCIEAPNRVGPGEKKE